MNKIKKYKKKFKYYTSKKNKLKKFSNKKFSNKKFSNKKFSKKKFSKKKFSKKKFSKLNQTGGNRPFEDAVDAGEILASGLSLQNMAGSMGKQIWEKLAKNILAKNVAGGVISKSADGSPESKGEDVAEAVGCKSLAKLAKKTQGNAPLYAGIVTGSALGSGLAGALVYKEVKNNTS